MKKPLVLLFLLGAVGGLFFLLSRHGDTEAVRSEELMVYCAAGLQKPVNEIARQYEAEFGTHVRFTFAGSGALETQIQVAEQGDLFLPADDSYIKSAREKGLVRESMEMAKLTAVIVVPKGNPKKIGSLEDLKREGMRLSLAEPSAAVGKFVRKVLADVGDLNGIEARVVVTKPTVNNVVEDVATGAVDASIAWDSVAASFGEVEVVRVPAFEAHPQRASVGVLKNARVPGALHFARYLTAKDKGQKVFSAMHFAVPERADVWADEPEIILFSGSMLRPAIEDRIAGFQQREACRVTTVFDGCGVLVANMRAGARPAAYFSCDNTFLDLIEDRFEPRREISGNVIVMIVPKGNPKAIQTLGDLVKPGLKVGIADAEKSALGALTRTLLEKNGIIEPMKALGNLAVLVSKGDELVNQMQSGALDVALVYRSNAKASERITQDCDVVDIDQPEAHAVQPFAVAKDTAYPVLTDRLRDFLTGSENRAHYEALGFQWLDSN